MQRLIYESHFKCLWWYVWFHGCEKFLHVLLPSDLGVVPVQMQKWLGESTKEKTVGLPPSKVSGVCVLSLVSIF